MLRAWVGVASLRWPNVSSRKLPLNQYNERLKVGSLPFDRFFVSKTNSWRQRKELASPKFTITEPPPPLSISGDLENQKRFFQWLESQAGVKTPEDWYNIRTRDIIRLKGGILLIHVFKGSVQSMVKTMRPDYDWKPWLWRSRAPRIRPGVDLKEVRNYFQWIQVEKKLWDNIEVWYSVTPDWLRRQPGGAWFERQSREFSSFGSIIQAAYPEHQWNQDRFAAHHPLNSVQHQRAVLLRVAGQLGLKTTDDWYSFENEKKIRRIIRKHGSIASAVEKCFPEFSWEPWRFKKIADGFWDKPENARRYFNWLAEVLKIENGSQWYELTGNDLTRYYGGTLWKKHLGSVVDCLRFAFPERKFEPWLFKKGQSRLWTNVDTRRQFLDHVAAQLQIKTAGDWNSVTQAEVIKLGGGALLAMYDNSLMKALKDTFPQENWNLEGA